jgi:hypothetical protein
MQALRIDRTNLPDDEVGAIDSIELNLLHLQIGAQEFNRTLALYMHIQELGHQGLDIQTKVSWTRIAGRNGAIEAYGIAMVMQMINQARIPTLLRRVNMGKRKAATSLFADEFPVVAAVRNSTAHPGELSGKPPESDKHRLNDHVSSESFQLAPGAFVSDSMTAEDHRLLFSATFNGNLVKYELSEAKGAILLRVAKLYHEAYQPLGV